MVTVMKYLITYLDGACETPKVEPVEADDMADALAALERITVAFQVVPVGVRLAA